MVPRVRLDSTRLWWEFMISVHSDSESKLETIWTKCVGSMEVKGRWVKVTAAIVFLDSREAMPVAFKE